MSIISSFRSIKNKHDVYGGKDCMKKFCEFFREHAMKIINFKKKKNEFINKREAKVKNCKEKFKNKYLKDKKFRDHWHCRWKYMGAAHNICNLKYILSSFIYFPIVFHNGSNYNYNFIIKEVSRIV